MSKRDDKVYLRHILDSSAKIEAYLQGVNEEKFSRNTLIQDGLIRQLEIIGEAVKRVSSGLRDQYAHIPWKDIAGMRDKLIHDYFGIDLEAVWMTSINDVPRLSEQIRHILQDLESNRNQ